MPHYLISYDLNGPNPSHASVDEILEQLGTLRGRILETVWYVRYSGSIDQLSKQIDNHLSLSDRLVVAEVSRMNWRNLLVDDARLTKALRTT